MAQLTRRAVLASLAAVSTVPISACGRQEPVATEDPIAGGLDVEGVTAIAVSYTVATGDPVSDDVRRMLFPNESADPGNAQGSRCR